MDVRNARIEGQFELRDDGPGHRRTVRQTWACFDWRPDGSADWLSERVEIPANFRYDGSSRPNWKSRIFGLGWLVKALCWAIALLIPRWGFSSEGSGFHDRCFKARPFLSDGKRIGRKLTDLVFFELLKWRAATAENGRWKQRVAEVMWRAVRWFGEPVWDRHDSEYRSS